MTEPFLAEIRIFAFNYAPKGWATCDGQVMAIAQNQALFAIVGTTYGGDGVTTFALPDLRGRAPVHFGNGTTLGASAGELAHTLTTAELPQHIHLISGSSQAGAPSPTGNYWGTQAANPYGVTSASQMNPAAIGPAGGSQAHDNMQPYQVVNCCIALQGIFPPRN